MNSIYRRCACRVDGKQVGANCPQLESDPKHGSWTFYLAAGVDPKTGKRRQVRKSGFKTKQAAQKARNEAAVKIDQGTYVPPTRELYREYLWRWLKRHQTTGDGLKDTTVANYTMYIRNDIAPSALGRMTVTEIRRFHVSAFIDQLTADGRGPTTIRRIIAVVQGSLHSAFDDHLIDMNPAAGAKLPRVETKEFDAWPPNQVGHFLDVASTHRLSALFELAIYTGMRRGELIGLRWSDIDLTRGVLNVRNNRVQAGGVIVENAPKTRAGRRQVPLVDAAVGAVMAWQLYQDAESREWGAPRTPEGYVFTYEDGEPLKPQYVTRLFEKLRVVSDLPKITFHGLRHETVSLLIEAGVELSVISKMLGHSSVSITADIYGHLIGTVARRGIENAALLVPRKSAAAHTLHTQGVSEGMKKAPEPATSA